MSDEHDASPSDVDTGVLQGRWCTPSNDGVARPGTVQEEAVAREQGYEAPTVAGAVHVEQFVPLLLEHFGAAWWQRGSVSLHCVSTTVVNEPVRCYLQPQDGEPDRARVWMNGEGEELVLEGTAALGEDPGSTLRSRLARVRTAETVTLLERVRRGDESRLVPLRIDSAAVDARLPRMTEPMAEYRQDDSAPGRAVAGRVAPPALLLAAVRAVEADIAPATPAPMDAFGGIELEYVDGPVLCDRDYVSRGRVLAITASEHTEILWYQAEVLDAADESPVARVLSMNRLMEPAA